MSEDKCAESRWRSADAKDTDLTQDNWYNLSHAVQLKDISSLLFRPQTDSKPTRVKEGFSASLQI